MTVDNMRALLSAITRIADTYPTQEGGQVGKGMSSETSTTGQLPSRRAVIAAQEYLKTRAELREREADSPPKK